MYNEPNVPRSATTGNGELAYNDLYFSAGATGLAVSVFYVGNILNAVDLAERRNEVASAPYRRALTELLLPSVEGLPLPSSQTPLP